MFNMLPPTSCLPERKHRRFPDKPDHITQPPKENLSSALLVSDKQPKGQNKQNQKEEPHSTSDTTKTQPNGGRTHRGPSDSQKTNCCSAPAESPQRSKIVVQVSMDASIDAQKKNSARLWKMSRLGGQCAALSTAGTAPPASIASFANKYPCSSDRSIQLFKEPQEQHRRPGSPPSPIDIENQSQLSITSRTNRNLITFRSAIDRTPSELQR